MPRMETAVALHHISGHNTCSGQRAYRELVSGTTRITEVNGASYVKGFE